MESRALNEQMKSLSQELFGASSRFKKLYSYKKLITEKQEEMVPGKNGEPDTVAEVDVPLTMNGTNQYVTLHRTTEEVLQLLLDFKARRDAYLAEVEKKKQEQAEAKARQQLADKVQEELSGSALT